MRSNLLRRLCRQAFFVVGHICPLTWPAVSLPTTRNFRADHAPQRKPIQSLQLHTFLTDYICQLLSPPAPYMLQQATFLLLPVISTSAFPQLVHYLQPHPLIYRHIGVQLHHSTDIYVSFDTLSTHCSPFSTAAAVSAASLPLASPSVPVLWTTASVSVPVRLVQQVRDDGCRHGCTRLTPGLATTFGRLHQRNGE